MKPSEALQTHITAIRNAVQRHHTTNPRVFGSVLAVVLDGVTVF